MSRERAERQALEAALGAVRRRERSIAELRAWLTARGFDAVEVDAAIEELSAAGELDDERFARLFAEDKRELAGWGPERIAAALTERGIAAELVERACAAEGQAAQIERAGALLERRGRSLGSDRDRQRALGFLTRRGYSYEVAYEAIRNRRPAA